MAGSGAPGRWSSGDTGGCIFPSQALALLVLPFGGYDDRLPEGQHNLSAVADEIFLRSQTRWMPEGQHNLSAVADEIFLRSQTRWMPEGQHNLSAVADEIFLRSQTRWMPEGQHNPGRSFVFSRGQAR